MTTVDLANLRDVERRREAVRWLIQTHGTTIDGKWSLKDFRYIIFENPKDATFFILRWS